MQRNIPGRHRKPSATHTFAARTAVSAAGAAAALLVSAGAATAATTPSASAAAVDSFAAPSGQNAAPAILPCTGTPLDNITKSATGSFCGSGPGDSGGGDSGGGDESGQTGNDTGGGNPPSGKVS